MDKCKECGTELRQQKPGEEREPCPNCGSMVRIIHETIRETVEVGVKSKIQTNKKD